jgi:hypothetical protein
MRCEARELDANPLWRSFGLQRFEQHRRRRLPLVVAECAVPLGVVGDKFVGCRFQHRLFWCDEGHVPIGMQRRSGRHRPWVAGTRQVLHMFDRLDDYQIELLGLHFCQHPLLAAAGGGGVEIESRHACPLCNAARIPAMIGS